MKEYEELNTLINFRYNGLVLKEKEMRSALYRLKMNAIVLLISMSSLLAFPDYILMGIFFIASILVALSFHRYFNKVIIFEKDNRMIDLLISERDALALVIAEEN